MNRHFLGDGTRGEIPSAGGSIGGRAGLVCICVRPSLGSRQCLQFAVIAAVMHHPAFPSRAGRVSDIAVLAGIVHDGFIDRRAVVIVVASVKVIDFGTVVNIIFDAVHRSHRVCAAHLNLHVLHEEEVLACCMVHMTLDQHGGLRGVGGAGNRRTDARHASSPECAEDRRAGKVRCGARASRLGSFPFATVDEKDRDEND